MHTNTSQYVSNKDGVFYYFRRAPNDVRQHYASSRISFSLRTKSQKTAARAGNSVTQRLVHISLYINAGRHDPPPATRVYT